MKRRVIIDTTNENKLIEFTNQLTINYGIEVVQLSKTTIDNPDYVTIALLKEESNLYNVAGEIVKNINDGDIVTNKSVLTVNDFYSTKTYKASILGVIDFSKKKTVGVFGWDSVFVPLSTGKSYHEMRILGLKVSARDQVISQWVIERFHYKERVDLNFNKVNQEEVISFDSMGKIVSNPLFAREILQKQNLDILLDAVVQNGVFFKAAKNRKEKNYWLPSLNAGIPLVPKKDAVHEATFQFHDFMHFWLPDLLIDESNNKKLYIIYRMMSEAFSLVYADMLYIDCLKRYGINYDFSKRKIYPLYTEAVANGVSRRNILHAVSLYVILGDTSELAQFTSTESLNNFTIKYQPFFVEDYRWTNQNWHNVKLQDLRLWMDDLKQYNLPNTFLLSSIDKQFGDTDLFEKTFEFFFNHFDRIVTTTKNPSAIAFKRYLVGQSALFSKYSFHSKSLYFYNKIKEIILGIDDNVTMSDIYKYKNMMSEFVKEMYHDNLICLDDYETYKEVYPIFKPFYINYDNNFDSYEDLKNVADKILKDEK